ncbi:hypothetical protein ACX80G_06675 [Arthrobacter sp. HLT1-21]
MSDARRLVPAANERTGHICHDDEEPLREPDVVFVGESARQTR